MERVFITGIGGQDGSILAQRLNEKYEVHGMIRRSSYDNESRLSGIKATIHYGDLTDQGRVSKLIGSVGPKIVFHMADQDEVWYSFKSPRQSIDVTFSGVFNVLEAVRTQLLGNARIFVPSSATIYGRAAAPQTEETPHDPLSPYAACKAALLPLVDYYRHRHAMDVRVGIMFNHDSPRRGAGYLLDTIARKVRRVLDGDAASVDLYDLELKVDIGSALEFMDSVIAWMELPERSVLFKTVNFGTGKPFTVRQLAETAIEHAGLSSDVLCESASSRQFRQVLINGSRKLLTAINKTGFAVTADQLVRNRVEQ